MSKSTVLRASAMVALALATATAAKANIRIFTFTGPAIRVGAGFVGTKPGSINIALPAGFTFVAGSVTYSDEFYVSPGALVGAQVSEADFRFPDLDTGYTVDGYNSNQNGFFRSAQEPPDPLTAANPWNYSIIVQAATVLRGTSYAQVDPTATVTASYSPSPMPEPGSWALLVTGMGGVGAVMRRARRRPDAVATA